LHQIIADDLWNELDLIAPCDLERVCAYYGIRLVSRPMSRSISALYLILNGDCPEIIVNARDNSRRQRFSIAHELGHHVIGDRSDDTIRMLLAADRQLENESERKASQFAASLLMPALLVAHLVTTFLHEQSARGAYLLIADSFRAK
jgi:Zn-dependent peptidase ImmA (M78 family)